MLNYCKDNTDEVTLEINYVIKLKDKNLLSVQYSGMGYSKGAAHPNNLFYTTNINLISGTRIRLADLLISRIHSDAIYATSMQFL